VVGASLDQLKKSPKFQVLKNKYEEDEWVWGVLIANSNDICENMVLGFKRTIIS
jgi:hypothetical protein